MIGARERRLLAALAVAAFALRAGFAWVTPPFQAPDEQAHVRYVAYLAEHARLPVQPERSLALFADPMHQSYQPPLAYALFAPLERALGGSERRTRVIALRLQNALYGALTAAVGYAVAARLTPLGDPRRALVAGVLAFLPGFVGSGAAVNNDGLANLLAALWWLVRGAGGRPRPWLSGCVFGAACLAKLTVLSLAPLLLLVPLLERRGDLRGACAEALRAGAAAALVLSPWLLRNVAVYGDPLAVGTGSLALSWLKEVLPVEALAQAARPRPGNTLLQFAGRFGIANNLRWAPIPWLAGALALLAAAGWLRPGARLQSALARAWPAFAAAALLAAAGLAWFSLRYAGGWQGRYLYGALLPVAALLAAGWGRALPERGRLLLLPIALLAALDVALWFVLREFYAMTPPAAWLLATPL